MKGRVIVHLLPEEREWLGIIAQEDVRTPRDVIRYLLTREAANRGLIDDKERRFKLLNRYEHCLS